MCFPSISNLKCIPSGTYVYPMLGTPALEPHLISSEASYLCHKKQTYLNVPKGTTQQLYCVDKQHFQFK